MSVMPQPSPMQPPGGSPPGGQMGTSPATQPVPNRGTEVMAQQGTALVIKLMGELISKAGAGTDHGMALASAIKLLSKFVKPGASNPSQEQNQLKELAMKQQQMSQMGKPQGM